MQLSQEQAHLDQVLALSLGDEWLQLGGGEGVHEAGLGDDQQQDLGTGEDRQFVCLSQEDWLVWRSRNEMIETRGEGVHLPGATPSGGREDIPSS